MDPYLIAAGGSARRMLAADLDRLKDRCSALEAPLKQAADALSAARAAFEALRDEYNAANEQCRAVQRTLVRAIVGAVPLEILRVIFLEVARALDPTSNEIVLCAYNSSRSTLPFTLSAVSKQWHAVAFDIPALWAYVALPPDLSTVQGRAFLLRARTLFKRSKSSPLDIVARCPDDYDDARLDWFQKIAREAARHVHRWRRVSLALHKILYIEDLKFLRNPTPILEVLSISDQAKSALPWIAPFPVYLPECPALRRLSIWTTFFSPIQPIKSLVMLDIFIAEDTYPFMWDTLGKLPMLQKLLIHFNHDLAGMFAPASVPLRLASLKSLRLQAMLSVVAEWKDVVEFPHLEALTLLPESAQALLDIIPFVESVCADITAVGLGRAAVDIESAQPLDITADIVPLLTACRHIKELVFDNCAFQDDAFFSTLGLADPAPGSSGLVLPNLQSVALVGGTLSDGAADSFSAFVRLRAMAAENDAQDSLRSPLRVRVTETTGTFPRWLARQLLATLGADCFVFQPRFPGHCDGLEDGVSLSSDASLEDEAEFSDSDAASASGESAGEYESIDFDSDVDVQEDSDYSPGEVDL